MTLIGFMGALSKGQHLRVRRSQQLTVHKGWRVYFVIIHFTCPKITSCLGCGPHRTGTGNIIIWSYCEKIHLLQPSCVIYWFFEVCLFFTDTNLLPSNSFMNTQAFTLRPSYQHKHKPSPHPVGSDTKPNKRWTPYLWPIRSKYASQLG